MKKQPKKTQAKIVYRGATMQEVFYQTHCEIVAHCEYCGKPMTRSDMNDYGSLCEKHYMQEYYGR